MIKGGVLDGKALTTEEITKLADLESREVLTAKLAGAMQASLSQAVYLFAAPLSQTLGSSTRCAPRSRRRVRLPPLPPRRPPRSPG